MADMFIGAIITLIGVLIGMGFGQQIVRKKKANG